MTGANHFGNDYFFFSIQFGVNRPLDTDIHTYCHFLYIHTLIYTCLLYPPCSMYVFGGMSARIQYDRLRAEGVGTNERAIAFLNQDFQALRQECLESNTLFEDPCFPARAPSLGFKELAPNSSKTRGVEWKRPKVSHIITH